MHPLSEMLLQDFHQNSHPELAVKMKKYMKEKFEYFGITSPRRAEITKHYLQKQNLPNLDEANEITRDIWCQQYREPFYFAIELQRKYAGKYPEDQIELYEWMVINQSWWDSVDGIAANLIGSYFKLYPDKIKDYLDKWLQSGNMWLQRSTIIFQLKYGKKTDIPILEKTIHHCKASKEFFLRKAIGWALRQYGKCNPEYVTDFVEKNPDLSTLSKKEALKHLI